MAHHIQTNFTAGELSPRLTARIDYEKYANGCQTLENFIVHPHGGASRRPGTEYIAETKTSSNSSRLIPFEFSTEQAYVLEFGHEYMRVFKDGGQVISGASPYELATPYDKDDLFELKFCQSADTMYIVHPYYEPRKLTRTGHTTWTLTTVSFTDAPSEWSGSNHYPAAVMFYEQRLWFSGSPYEPQTFWASRVGDYEDLGQDSPITDDNACEFTLVADQVNAIEWLVPGKRLMMGTSGGEWEVGGPGSEGVTPTNVTAQRHSTHGSHPNAMPVTASNIAVFIQRGGRKVRELAYNYEADGYVAPDLTLLAEHLGDESSFKQLAYQQDPDSLVWAIREDGTLCAMTYLREQKVYGWHRHPLGGDGEVESICTIPGDDGDELWAIVKRTVDDSTVRYVERLAGQFRETDSVDAFFVDSGLSYDGRNTDSDQTFTLTPATAGEWAINDTGTLTATGHTPFSAAGEVYALHDPSASSYDARGSIGKVEVTAVASSSSATVKFLNAIPEAVRSTATFNWATLTDSVSNADHIEGESVQILADGAIHPARTVSSGAVSLNRYAAVVHLGLGYTSNLETMAIEMSLSDGTAQGRTKRISRLLLRLYRSLGCKAGPDADNLDEIWFRSSSDALGVAPALYSGDKELDFPEGPTDEAVVYVRQDQPLPLTVLALVAETKVQKR